MSTSSSDAPYDWGTVLRVMIELDTARNQMPILVTDIAAALAKKGADDDDQVNSLLNRLVNGGKLRGNNYKLQLATGPELNRHHFIDHNDTGILQIVYPIEDNAEVVHVKRNGAITPMKQFPNGRLEGLFPGMQMPAGRHVFKRSNGDVAIQVNEGKPKPTIINVADARADAEAAAERAKTALPTLEDYIKQKQAKGENPYQLTLADFLKDVPQDKIKKRREELEEFKEQLKVREKKSQQQQSGKSAALVRAGAGAAAASSSSGQGRKDNIVDVETLVNPSLSSNPAATTASLQQQQQQLFADAFKPGSWFPGQAPDGSRYNTKPLFKRKFVCAAAAISYNNSNKSNNENNTSSSSGNKSSVAPVTVRPNSKCIQATQTRYAHRVQANGPSNRAFLWPGTPPWILDPEGFFRYSGMGGEKGAGFSKVALGFLRETGMQQRHLDLRWQYFTEVVLPHGLNTPTVQQTAEEAAELKKRIVQEGGEVNDDGTVSVGGEKIPGLQIAAAFGVGGACPVKMTMTNHGPVATATYSVWRDLFAEAGFTLASAEKLRAAASSTKKKDDKKSSDDEAKTASDAAKEEKEEEEEDEAVAAAIVASFEKRKFPLSALFQMGHVHMDPAFDDTKLEVPARCSNCDAIIDFPYPPECMCGAFYCSTACWEDDQQRHRAQCELRLENQLLNLALSENCARLIQETEFYGDFYEMMQNNQVAGASAGPGSGDRVRKIK